MRSEERAELVPIRAVLPVTDNIVYGFQHVLAMFGGTILGPLLMGFDPNVSLFFSGFGTLLFFVLVRWGKVPSYLGSSFSFIAAVNAATAYSGGGPNDHLAIALGGIIAAGSIYAAIGLLVIWAGYSWLEKLLPPVLTGLVVGIIGVNLASVAVGDVSHSRFDTMFGLATILIISVCNVYLPRSLGRLPILIGGGASYLLYIVLGNALGLGTPIDFAPVAAAQWIDLPHFRSPSFDRHAISLIAPVAIILVAENLGHIRAVSSMVREDLDPFLGRAFFADGLATIVSGFGGGTGITTYAENIAVMSMTRVFSARVFVFAGFIALALSFLPKVGAAIATIPSPILGGLGFILFGTITVSALRIWHEAKIDFTKPHNAIPVGVGLIMGAGNLTLSFGVVTLGGIASATVSAIVLFHVLKGKGEGRGAPGL